MVCCRGEYEGNAATDRLASLLCVPVLNTAIITNNVPVWEGVSIRLCQDKHNPHIDAIIDCNLFEITGYNNSVSSNCEHWDVER